MSDASFNATNQSQCNPCITIVNMIPNTTPDGPYGPLLVHGKTNKSCVILSDLLQTIT